MAGVVCSIDDALVRLAVTYERGLLVPFVGSGLSVPMCAGWEDLVHSLCAETGAPVPRFESGTDRGSILYRRADAVTQLLRSLPVLERAELLRKALDHSRDQELPPQSVALARLYWPLVLTTNYDDVLLASMANSERIRILGRSRSDCHDVLRSLDINTDRILWALQGYVGGPCGPSRLPAQRQGELASQVVLGHQQYQRTANESPHFRRSFGEIYRRRVLLFVGSGILEPYLVSLLGEIIHHHGGCPRSHFALICREDPRASEYDAQFLQSRLGIVPVFFESFDELPCILNDLADCVACASDVPPRRLRPGMKVAVSSGYSFDVPRTRAAPLSLTVAHRVLPVPAADECIVVSVGRSNGRPLLGNQARHVIDVCRERELVTDSDEWEQLGQTPYAFRLGRSCVFAVAARATNRVRRHDARDLRVIADAVCQVLKEVDELGQFTSVYIGAVSAGPESPWRGTIHPFGQALVGIGQFSTHQSTSVSSITMCIVDPSTWFPFIAARLRVEDLLSSDLVSVPVIVHDSDGVTEAFTWTTRLPVTIGDLFKETGLATGGHWQVEVQPPPADDESLDVLEAPAVPTMTLLVRSMSART